MPISISGDGTLTGVSVGGLPDGIVDTDMLATSAVTAAKIGTNTFVSYAILAQVESDGTDGGSSVQDTWTTRTLNTEVADPDGIVTLSSNQFTLGAGSYLIKWTAMAYSTSGATARLYDATNTTAIQNGITGVATSTYNGTLNSIGSARVAPTGSTAYEIQMNTNQSQATNGFGKSNAATGGGDEVYVLVEIYKEA